MMEEKSDDTEIPKLETVYGLPEVYKINEVILTEMKEINIYIDSTPGSVIPQVFASRPTVPMGQDAALSTVTTHALSYLDYIKTGRYLLPSKIKKMTRDDAGPYWEAGLAPEGKPISFGRGSQVNLIKSVIGSLPFVKAIMDSACLGESVCISMDKSLCESLRPFDRDKTRSLIEIYKRCDTERRDNFSRGTELLDFLLQMSYCDVFELVSSDKLGAVNGLYSVKTINNTLPFISYISIPKGAGGQIGIDFDIFIITTILHIVLYPDIALTLPQTFDDLSNFLAARSSLIEFLGSSQPISRDEIKLIITNFRRFQEKYNGGICDSETDLCQNFENCYSMSYLIKLFGNWFNTFKQTAIYTNIREDLKRSYNFITSTDEHGIKVEVPQFNTERSTISYEYLVWFSFQITRYINTGLISSGSQKMPYVYTLTATTDQIIAYLETEKQNYSRQINDKKAAFLEKWFDALRLVAINEAFAGHDNKSDQLLTLGKTVFSDLLSWVDYYKARDGIGYNFHNIEYALIKKIQQETECMFLQYCPTPDGEPGVLFSTNTNMVFSNKIGDGTQGFSTPNSSTVYEIFVNNIGSKRIISTYDLEKYEGETASGEKAGVLVENLIAGIMTARQQIYKDKILEIQGIICTLDRASRTSHPRTIYCTGCLNIPIQINDIMNITISYEVYNNKIHTCSSDSHLPGLYNYTLYQYEPLKRGEELFYELMYSSGLSKEQIDSTEQNQIVRFKKNMALLLTFINEMGLVHWNTILPNIRKKFIEKYTDTAARKKKLTELGITKAPQKNEFKKYMKLLFKNAEDELIKDIIFNILQQTIDFQTNIKHKNPWDTRFGYLLNSYKRNIGKAIIEIFGANSDIQRSLRRITLYEQIFMGTFTPRISSTNTTYSVRKEESIFKSFSDVFLESGGLKVGKVSAQSPDGIEIHSEELSELLTDTSKIPEDQADMVIREQQDIIEVTEIEGLTNEFIMTENSYQNAIKYFEQEYRDVVHKAERQSVTVATATAAFSLIVPGSLIQQIPDQYFSLLAEKTKLEMEKASALSILRGLKEDYNFKFNQYNEYRNLKYPLGIQEDLGIQEEVGQKRKANQQQQRGDVSGDEGDENETGLLLAANEAREKFNTQQKNLKPIITTITKRLQNIETEIESYNISSQFLDDEIAGGQRLIGGKLPDNNLVGKLVVFKYDVKQNKYYITDYVELVKLWFNKMYGIKDQQTISIKEPQKVLAKGISQQISPGGKSAEWWKQTGDIIRNNPLFQSLSQEQQKKKYKEIIKNVFENIKTIQNSKEAINKSIQEAIPFSLKPGMSSQQQVSLSPIQREVGLPMGQTVRVGGLTKRRKNRHKLTRKKYRKVKARKTRYQYKKHRYTRHKK